MACATHVEARSIQGGQPTAGRCFQDRNAFRRLGRSKRGSDCARWVAKTTSLPLLGRSPKMPAKNSTAV